MSDLIEKRHLTIPARQHLPLLQQLYKIFTSYSLSGYRAVGLSVQEVPDLVSLSGYRAVHLSVQEVPDLVSLSGYRAVGLSVQEVPDLVYQATGL